MSASPSWSPPSPTLFPEEDPAVADQYLKGETLTVHQVKAATSELQPQLELFRKQLQDLFYLVLVTMTSLSGLASPALVQNSKRQQLQANERLVTG